MIMRIIMSVAAFGMVILLSARGVEAEYLDDFKGLNQRNPYYAAIMGLVLFSMAGVPPMVGFFANADFSKLTVTMRIYDRFIAPRVDLYELTKTFTPSKEFESMEIFIHGLPDD